MKLLYFNNAAYGGLAQYSHYQANALVRAGCEVDFLCPENYPEFPETRYQALRILTHRAKRENASKLSRLRGFFGEITSDIRTLAECAQKKDSGRILFGSYLEYFSPFWAGSLCKLRSQGMVFGSVLHDPVRDSQLGPAWWHRHSVKKAYSFIDILFLHQKLKESLPEIPTAIPQIIIPHGPYPVYSSTIEKSAARKKLGLPASKIILLSFGHIRDNKNLDLAIRCLADHPDVHILVAGQLLNEAQKTPEYYKSLAKEKGVETQVTWLTSYIPDEKVSELFNASDGILLTYSSGFRSASGVLNLASTFDKPCIASSGPSPLEDLVKAYKLGVWVDPDDEKGLSLGMKLFQEQTLAPDWEGYRRDNSWDRNADIVTEAFKNQPAHS